MKQELKQNTIKENFKIIDEVDLISIRCNLCNLYIATFGEAGKPEEMLKEEIEHRKICKQNEKI